MDFNETKRRPDQSILKSECHLHLYGCLPASTLYGLAEGRIARFPERWTWFLENYKNLLGDSVAVGKWFNKGTAPEDHFHQFQKDFLFHSPGPFEQFQAKFNLLIALFPPSPGDMTLAKAVFEHHADSGGIKEYRTFLPLYLDDQQREQYLLNLITTATDYATASYRPLFAISIVREDEGAQKSYDFIRYFLNKYPEARSWITGIDFCASEVGHPPSSKKDLFSKILNDHRPSKNNSPHLQILYHVGEMWQNISIASAARWCVEAADYGAHRLGHALALGMNPHVVAGTTIEENKNETKAHLKWIEGHLCELNDHGFTHNDFTWLVQRAASCDGELTTNWQYDDDLIDHTRRFQAALLPMVRQRNPLIENCPTSNMRIGSLRSPDDHPLRFFLDHNLRVVVATDDPGIFGIELGDEEQFCRDEFHLTDFDLANMEQLTINTLTDTSSV